MAHSLNIERFFHWLTEHPTFSTQNASDILGCDVDDTGLILRIMNEKTQAEFGGFFSSLGGERWRVSEDALDIDIKKIATYFPLSIFYERFYSRGTGRRAFLVEKMAQDILSEYYIITDSKSKEIYVYGENGIYSPIGEDVIRKAVVQRLGNQAKRYHSNETIYMIQTLTLEDHLYDKGAYLVATENCILDLNRGRTLPLSPEIICLTKIPVRCDASILPENFLKFLEEVVELQNLPVIQEIFGYCLFKDYRFQKSILLVGSGANGKSTLLGVLTSFLGRKNVSAIPLQSFDTNRFAVAGVRGKLANVYPDLPDKALKNTGVFKLLCGSDQVSAELKFGGFVEFTNHAKMIFSANKLPEVYDESDAYYRRMLIISFPYQFEGKNAKKGLVFELTTPEELSGILNWSLEGLLRLLENQSFSNEEATDALRERYIRLSNPVQAFIMDCIAPLPEGWIIKKALYKEFLEYCRLNDLPTKAQNAFSLDLQRYYSGKIQDQKKRVSGKLEHIWAGITVKNPKNEVGESDKAGFLLNYVKDESDKKIEEITEKHDSHVSVASDEELYSKVLEKLAELEKIFGASIPLSELLKECEQFGVDRLKFDKFFIIMKEEGHAFEPKPGHIQKMENM